MYDKSGLFIDGRWAAALGGRTTPVMSPVSEYPLGQVPLAGLAGTNAAIASVSAGFAAWKPKSGYEPADALHAIANELKRRTDKAAAMAGENFGPIAAITRFLATAAVAGFRKLTETAATQAGKGAH